MNTLQLNDLNRSEALDRKSMTELTGAGAWHQRGATYYNGAWSGYSFVNSQYQGLTYHDGYLSRHTYETWKRTRVQTEYSFWDHFVRV